MPRSSPKRRSRPVPVGHNTADIYIKPDPDAPASTSHSSQLPAELEDDDDPLAITPNPITHRSDKESRIPIVRRNRPSGSGKRVSDHASVAGPSIPTTPPPRPSRPSKSSTPAPKPAAHPKTPRSQGKLHAQTSAQAPAAQASSSRQRMVDAGPILKPYECPITGNKLDEDDGDVILTSGDGYTFRCHSFHLKSASPILRDLLAAQSPSTRIFLCLPEEASIIYAFLHLQTVGSYHRHIYEMEMTDTSISELQRLETLIAMCDKYHATRFDQILILPYTRLAARLPWEVFSRACKRSWPTVAREAIRYFGCMERNRIPETEEFWPGRSTCKMSHKCLSRWKSGVRDWAVGDLGLEAAEGLGMRAYHALARAIQCSDSYARSWSDVADVFNCPPRVL